VVVETQAVEATVHEPFDKLRINSASGISSILDKALKGKL
jgi:hypothetical protein